MNADIIPIRSEPNELKFRPIPADLFGLMFPKGQQAFDAAISYAAAHLAGYQVEWGVGPGEVEIDLTSLVVEEHNSLVRLVNRIKNAGDKADAAKMYDECIPRRSRKNSDREIKRSVGERRAEIENWELSQGPAKASCDLPQHYGNVGEILRTKIEPHLHLAEIFQRDGALVRIVDAENQELRSVSGLSISGPSIDQHDVDSIVPAISEVIRFTHEKVVGRGELVKAPCPPPTALMRQLLRLRRWPNVPRLAGITSGPFLRHDGSVCIQRGYDPVTGWFLDYHGEPIEVPDKPTRGEAVTSCQLLLDLVDQFEWASETQKAGWLAYLLTLVARPGINGFVPAFVFTASTPGAGKSLLATVANIIAFGRSPSGYKAPKATHDDAGAEWKKMLFAFAMTANPSLVVSNFPSGKPVGNAEIDGQITERTVIDRVLGRTETREVAWVATMAFTGNNLGTTADFVFRSIWACLEPTAENPRSRSGFAIADLAAHVTERRSTYLREALTILRWHAANGKPGAGGVHYGSFEAWASTVRDAVMHLTGYDVTDNGKDAVVADEESSELGTLLSGLADYAGWRAKNNRPERFTVAEIHTDLNAFGNETAWPDLREAVDSSVSQKAFSSTVGKLLSKHKGRVSEGKKLILNMVSKKPYWRITDVAYRG